MGWGGVEVGLWWEGVGLWWDGVWLWWDGVGLWSWTHYCTHGDCTDVRGDGGGGGGGGAGDGGDDGSPPQTRAVETESLHTKSRT